MVGVEDYMEGTYFSNRVKEAHSDVTVIDMDDFYLLSSQMIDVYSNLT